MFACGFYFDDGYGTLAKLKMPLWFFPILILGPISIRRVCRRAKTEAI